MLPDPRYLRKGLVNVDSPYWYFADPREDFRSSFLSSRKALADRLLFFALAMSGASASPWREGAQPDSAADREDPTSQKRIVVEREASKSYVGQAAIPPGRPPVGVTTFRRRRRW